MGVYRTDYLMVGVEVDMDKFDYDKFEDEINGAPNKRFDIVYDGMCGEYCIAGKIIAKSDGDDGFKLNKINPVELNGDKYDLSVEVSDAFGYHIPPDDFSLMLFSHYS